MTERHKLIAAWCMSVQMGFELSTHQPDMYSGMEAIALILTCRVT